MSSEAKLTRLEHVLNFANGRTSPEREDAARVPVFGSNGLIGRARETNSPPNTIVIGRVGSYCGSVHFSRDACWVTDNAIRATAKGENDPSFLYYLLKHLNLNTWRSGSGQPLINQATLNAIEAQVPPPSVQRVISGLVGSLDDRISLLRETNATLEAIAQALFKSWFVDFDPVRAKQEGRAPEGMSDATAALFPDSFEESELGLVPKGWQVLPVGEVVNVTDYVANGSFAALKENVTLLAEPSYALYVRTTDFNSGFSGEFRYVDKSAYDFLAKSSLDGNEVIISNVGDVGTVFRPPRWLGLPMTLGSNAVALKKPEMVAFLYFHFSGPQGQHDIQSIVTGSAQLKFNKTNFRALRILLPDSKCLAAFEAVANTLWSRVENNLAQAQTLAALRDTLLPRLISGQLRLPEAEALIEEATA